VRTAPSGVSLRKGWGGRGHPVQRAFAPCPREHDLPSPLVGRRVAVVRLGELLSSPVVPLAWTRVCRRDSPATVHFLRQSHADGWAVHSCFRSSERDVSPQCCRHVPAEHCCNGNAPPHRKLRQRCSCTVLGRSPRMFCAATRATGRGSLGCVLGVEGPCPPPRAPACGAALSPIRGILQTFEGPRRSRPQFYGGIVAASAAISFATRERTQVLCRSRLAGFSEGFARPPSTRPPAGTCAAG
jgi:hypothetical protein